MEANTFSSGSSSSAPSGTYLSQYPKEPKDLKPTQSFHSSLHSVRKPQLKPWKKPIAPMPPIPSRVYKVEAANFRDIVQKLTGSAAQHSVIQPHQQRLHSMAPPPLGLADRTTALFGGKISATRPAAAAAHSQLLIPSSENETRPAVHQNLASQTVLDTKYNKTPDGTVMASSSLELNLSPSSYNWFSFPLLSPGTLSSLEQSTVL